MHEECRAGPSGGTSWALGELKQLIMILLEALGSATASSSSVEALEVDSVATLFSLSAMTLGCAIVLALVVTVTVAARIDIPLGQRYWLGVAWCASVVVSALTAVPIGQWGLPMVALLSLPAAASLGRLARGPYERLVSTLISNASSPQ